ncbi:MAG TPA: hypothetical protein VJB94_00780 [Candidatus Nanoarchaeia archaeon]|nr:hypothetical protein [Candidatus Nanoarchaeia archaeon]
MKRAFNEQWEDFAKYIMEHSIAKAGYKVRASVDSKAGNAAEKSFNTSYAFIKNLSGVETVLAENMVKGVKIGRDDNDTIENIMTQNLGYLRTLLGKYPNIITEKPSGLEFEVRNAIRGLHLIPFKPMD